MTDDIAQAAETAAPVDGDQPTQTVVDDDMLELLESARADLAPGIFADESGESGAEAAASEGEQQPLESSVEDDVSRKPLPQEVQQSIDRRIGKEVSKRKELEDQLENERSNQRHLEEELKAARAVQSEPSIVIRSDDPYAGMTGEDLAKKEKELATFKGWALRNWDGYTGSGEEDDPDWEAQQVRERYAQIEEELGSDLPQAHSRLADRQTMESRAVTQFPFLMDKSLPGFEEAQRLYNTKPFQELLKVDPSALILLGHAARDIYNTKMNGSASSPVSEAPPVVPTEVIPTGGPGPGAPARVKTTGLTAARMKAAADGRLDDVVGEMLGV